MSNTDDLEAREPITHELKCHPGPFAAVKSGAKPFEWRKDDRDYRVGDTLWLREFRPVTVWEADEGMESTYTGQHVHRTVTYIIREGFGIPPSYCIMGLGSLAQPLSSERIDPRSDIVTAGNALVAALWAQADKDPEDDECWVLPMTHQSAIERWKKALAAHPKDPAPTVDAIMKEVNAWADDQPHVGRYSATKQADLRTRLKTLFP